jgi:simple sugar transport system ATP-binding protein
VAALELEATGIVKRYGSLLANDHVDLAVARGEIHAVMGENGAGKSTLMSILYGLQQPDEGVIRLRGREVRFRSPHDAIAEGMGMVHQAFKLFNSLTVSENITYGSEPQKAGFLDRRAARAKVVELAGRYQLKVDPDAAVGKLSVGVRQRVEILKALYRDARILILDEPTAVLTPQESASLFTTLEQMVASGMAIVFISHKLDEVLAVADRIVVLRAGRAVARLDAAVATHAGLAEAMVGRTVAPVARQRSAVADATVACALRDVTVRQRERVLLDRVNLEVHAGEVVAIAGVAGNGQQALADLLSGVIALDEGGLEVAGRTLPAQPRAWIDAGVARIPEDRQGVGAIGDLAIWENALLERYASRRFARWGVLWRERALEHARRIVERFDVRGGGSAGLDARTAALSGGNLQKLILGRALTSPRYRDVAAQMIVAHQPTWGLDVGAVADVHRRLLDACQAGAALLLISEDLDEILALADRIAVITRGRLTDARRRDDWSLATLGLAMGASAADAPARARHDAT